MPGTTKESVPTAKVPSARSQMRGSKLRSTVVVVAAGSNMVFVGKEDPRVSLRKIAAGWQNGRR